MSTSGLVQNIITTPYSITFIIDDAPEAFPRDIELNIVREEEYLTVPIESVSLGDEIVSIANYGDY